MKKVNKFKQFSRNIKLMIITALIISCVGVYAAGACIVAATSDDVTYNNSTVTAALNELYTLANNHCPEGHICSEKKYALDCNNNKLYTTTPSGLKGLAKIMAYDAYLDNGQSEYVTSCNGVDLSKISAYRSDPISRVTNGHGIYEVASTKNDTYPIYYYRGAVTNNYVKFAGLCWRAVRTTDTGGVKMIYGGNPGEDVRCPNTWTGGVSKVRFLDLSMPYFIDFGYMYGISSYERFSIQPEVNVGYVFGNDVTYSNGTYTLTNTMTTTGNWETDYTTIYNNHYTCFSTGTTCSDVNYVYFTSSTGASYITLTNGKKVEDALDEIFNGSNINTYDSDEKTTVDNWYNTNLSDYTNYIEDTVYCSDRSMDNIGGWDPNGGDTTIPVRFNTYYRGMDGTITLDCIRPVDRFTVSEDIGNGALTYPIGLITVDEAVYSGGIVDGNVSNSYLGGSADFFTMSPRRIFPSPYVAIMNSSGQIMGGAVTYVDRFYYRPVISLSPNAVISDGDGTQNNPYIVDTN